MKFDNNTSNGGGDFEQPSAGTKPSRLVGLYDIGLQKGKAFNGEPAKDRNQAVFVFELVGKEKQSDGKPFLVSKFVTVSLHKKGSLVPILKAFGVKVVSKDDNWWEAPKINWSTLLGEPIMISIEISENGRANIASISSPIEGMTFAEPITELGYLNLDEEGYLDQFNKAPAWIQKKCQEALDWQDRQ